MLECVKVWRRRVRANNVFSAHLRSFSLWDRESTAYELVRSYCSVLTKTATMMAATIITAAAAVSFLSGAAHAQGPADFPPAYFSQAAVESASASAAPTKSFLSSTLVSVRY